MKIDMRNEMNLFIFGANWYNRGDEAAIRAMIDELRRLYPDAHFKIQFNQEVDIFPYEDIEIIPRIKVPSKRRNIIDYVSYMIASKTNWRVRILTKRVRSNYKRLMQAVEWSDIAIYAPGGPSIGDYYRQYYLLDIMVLLRNARKPYFIYAPSMGPFSKNGKRIRDVLKDAMAICVREKISYDHLQKLDLNILPVVTLDSAFQHSINKEEYIENLIKDKGLFEFISKHERIIGMTLTDLMWHNEYKNTELDITIRDSFQRFIGELSKNGYAVLFLPQLFGIHNDMDYMKEFCEDNCYVMSDKHDCYFQQYIISKMYAVVGMRYHSNIFSAKEGTPFMSISYEPKMRGFMEKSELEDFYINVNDLSYESLVSKFSLLEQQYEKYKGLLNEKKEVFKEESYKTTELLCRCLNKMNS